MANKVDKAIDDILNSKFFKRGVETGDYSEIKKELKMFIEAYHAGACLLASRTYGKAKHSTQQVILPALREMEMDDVFLYIKNELRSMPLADVNYYTKNR